MELNEPGAKYLVKAGYKQTDIGRLPTDWLCSEIGDLIDLLTGFPFPSSGYSTSGTRLLRGSNVKRGETDWSDDICAFWPKVTGDIVRYLLKEGDIVVAMDGSLVGKSFARLAIDDLPALLLQRVARIRSSKLSQSYLSGWVCSSRFTDHCDSVKTTTAIPHISPDDIRSFKIGIPPTVVEQNAIGAALMNSDALIESLEQLLAKKRQIKQGAMQELLTGQRRLPGFSVEWPTLFLGDLGTFLKGSGITREQAQSGEIPCVRYGEIYTTHNDHIRTFESGISPTVAATATLLRQGDILFAGSGETKEDIGKCVAFLDYIEAYAGGDIVILRPRVSDPRFLGYALNTAEVNRQKASRGQGDAVVHISASALAQITVRVPELAEQTAIATVLSDMDTEITALEARLTKARHVKQGMAQALLTGRIRLQLPDAG